MGKTISRRKLRKIKAKAELVTEVEYQQVVTGKMRDKIHLQFAYAEAFLKRRVKESRLNALSSKIENAKKLGYTEVSWQSVDYDIDVLITEYNLEAFYYKQLLRDEVSLKDKLLKYGFTEEEISLIQSGKLLKGEKEFESAEKKLEDIKKKSRIGEIEYSG